MTPPSAPEGAPLGPALRASGNVRAEIARAAVNPRLVREAIGMSRTTWRRRMKEPGDWRLGELRKIADHLGIPIERLANGGER
jgi:hypothetical protein